jgi:hypothetical protein
MKPAATMKLIIIMNYNIEILPTTLPSAVAVADFS